MGEGGGPAGTLIPLTSEGSPTLSGQSRCWCLMPVPCRRLSGLSHPRVESGHVHFGHPTSSVGSHVCHPNPLLSDGQISSLLSVRGN